MFIILMFTPPHTPHTPTLFQQIGIALFLKMVLPMDKPHRHHQNFVGTFCWRKAPLYMSRSIPYRKFFSV